MTTVAVRTNEQWLSDLRSDGPERDAALADLRQVLMTGLRIGLSSWADTLGSNFDALAEDFAQETLLKILAHLDSFGCG